MYVLEKTPVRSTTQEVFTHGHNRGEIRNGVGRKVMELSSEKFQEAPKKRMRRKGETMVDVGSKEDALTRPRLGLHLPLRQPRRSGNNQTGVSQLLQILWPERRSDPIGLDPTRWQRGP